MISLIVACCGDEGENLQGGPAEFCRVSCTLYVLCAWPSLVAVFKRNYNVTVNLCNTPHLSSSCQCELAINVNYAVVCVVCVE